MTDEQLKDLLEIIINNTHETPSHETSYLLYNLINIDIPDNINSITIHPRKKRKFGIIPYNYLEFEIWGYSEGKSIFKRLTLENKYYFKTIKETIANRRRLYDNILDQRFNKALNNTFEKLGK